MGELEPGNINSCLSAWLSRSRFCQTDLISFFDEVLGLLVAQKWPVLHSVPQCPGE